MLNRLTFLAIALFLGCHPDTTPVYNTEAQSGTLYFTFSVYEDENYQAIDRTGKRAVAPDGKELFIRMADLEEKALRHLDGASPRKTPARQRWESDVVQVQARYRLYLDHIVNAPLADGGESSGREGWFVDLLDVSSSEWVELQK